jgi:outer membrane protein W
MRLRILLFLIASTLCISSQAQTNEIGVFANHTSLSSSTVFDQADGLTATVKFDSRVGYGLSFTHFLSPNVALQLSGQTLRADAKLEVASGLLAIAAPDGSLDLKQYDAAIHWYMVPRGAIRPYVGGGIAFVRSGKLKSPGDPAAGVAAETVTLDNKTTWLADAGLDYRVSQDVTITLAAKYTRYTAKINTTPDDLFQELKLDPLTLAAGVRFRF